MINIKDNGVVRKIDELGRIVIPKEFRKTLKIRDGENIVMNITNSNEIVIGKYSLFKDYFQILECIIQSINKYLNKKVLITDRDEYILVIGESKKEILGKQISEFLEKILKDKKQIINYETKNLIITNNKQLNCQYLINPIMNYGEPMGLLIIISDDNSLEKSDEKAVNIISDFLTKYIEK